MEPTRNGPAKGPTSSPAMRLCRASDARICRLVETCLAKAPLSGSMLLYTAEALGEILPLFRSGSQGFRGLLLPSHRCDHSPIECVEVFVAPRQAQRPHPARAQLGRF